MWLQSSKNSANSLQITFKLKAKPSDTDGGGEYQALQHLLANLGIEHLTSPPCTPEHVGSVECKHHHIVETSLTFLHNAALPLRFWSHAFQSAIYLINRMPTPILNFDTPYRKLFGQKPKYTSLQVFGCLCYPWFRPYNTHKLEPRFCPCVYLGFSLPHHSFLCFDISSNRLFVSRHVVFFEYIFPYKSKSYPNLCISTQTFSKYLFEFTGKQLDNITTPTKEALDFVVLLPSTPHFLSQNHTSHPTTT